MDLTMIKDTWFAYELAQKRGAGVGAARTRLLNLLLTHAEELMAVEERSEAVRNENERLLTRITALEDALAEADAQIAELAKADKKVGSKPKKDAQVDGGGADA